MFEKGNQRCDVINIAAFSAGHMLDMRPPIALGFGRKRARLAPDADEKGVAALIR